jgi:hypothetical protein
MYILAYLDPGTGSLILQVIIGGILGVGVVLKTYWSKIRRLFGKKKKSQTETDESTKQKNNEE